MAKRAPESAARRRQKAPKDRPPTTPGRVDLATEVFTLLRNALQRFGVNDEEQLVAIERSRTLAVPPNASGLVMRESWGLADLLMEWSRAPEYVDADGQPRLLRVKGLGATFQQLATRFLPHAALEEAVQIACARADVSLRPRGKIALLGSTMVDNKTTADIALAHTIRHIDQLLTTVLHNREVAEGRHPQAAERLERMVYGVIRERDLVPIMTALRPLIHDLCLTVDSAVEKARPTTPADLPDSTVLGFGVYFSSEPQWQRAGIDPSGFLAPSSEPT